MVLGQGLIRNYHILVVPYRPVEYEAIVEEGRVLLKPGTDIPSLQDVDSGGDGGYVSPEGHTHL